MDVESIARTCRRWHEGSTACRTRCSIPRGRSSCARKPRSPSWLGRGETDTEPLFTALADRALAADAELPSTGVTLEWERRLSAPFIVSETYGTRSSTMLTIDRDGDARFVERSFDAGGMRTGAGGAPLPHRVRLGVYSGGASLASESRSSRFSTLP